MNLIFTVPGIPIPQGSKVALAKGHLIDSNRAKLRAWREKVTAAALIALSEIPEWRRTGPMELHVTYYMPRPKLHYAASGALKKNVDIWHAKRPDKDKLDRAIGDALTAAGVWLDDCQSAAGSSCKRYVDESHPTPRAIVRVSHITNQD